MWEDTATQYLKEIKVRKQNIHNAAKQEEIQRMSGVDHIFKTSATLELSEDIIRILKDKVGIRRMLHFGTLVYEATSLSSCFWKELPLWLHVIWRSFRSGILEHTSTILNKSQSKRHLQWMVTRIVETEEEEERLVESLQVNAPTAPTPAAVTTTKSSTMWVKSRQSLRTCQSWPVLQLRRSLADDWSESFCIMAKLVQCGDILDEFLTPTDNNELS